MRGFQVHRKAGWDTHGLPVEIEVEKSLKMKHKDEIVTYGVARFNEESSISVEVQNRMGKYDRAYGILGNLNEPYVTFETPISNQSVGIKKYFDAGLIYKGFKIQLYARVVNTAFISRSLAWLSDVKDPSVYVKMKLSRGEYIFLV